MHLGSDDSVFLLVESKSTGEVTHTEDKQDVGEDTADHTGLYDVDLAFDEGENSYEKLDGITKGGVEQTAPCITDTVGELLGGE